MPGRQHGARSAVQARRDGARPWALAPRGPGLGRTVFLSFRLGGADGRHVLARLAHGVQLQAAQQRGRGARRVSEAQ